jgi:hypothetical protein
MPAPFFLSLSLLSFIPCACVCINITHLCVCLVCVRCAADSLPSGVFILLFFLGFFFSNNEPEFHPECVQR